MISDASVARTATLRSALMGKSVSNSCAACVPLPFRCSEARVQRAGVWHGRSGAGADADNGNQNGHHRFGVDCIQQRKREATPRRVSVNVGVQRPELCENLVVARPSGLFRPNVDSRGEGPSPRLRLQPAAKRAPHGNVHGSRWRVSGWAGRTMARTGWAATAGGLGGRHCPASLVPHRAGGAGAVRRGRTGRRGTGRGGHRRPPADEKGESGGGPSGLEWGNAPPDSRTGGPLAEI